MRLQAVEAAGSPLAWGVPMWPTMDPLEILRDCCSEPSSQLYLRKFLILVLSPLPPGVREGTGLSFSKKDRWFWSDSGSDPVCNLRPILMLA